MSFILLFLLLPSNCLVCHSDLKGVYQNDVHANHGIFCEACHGGNPRTLDSKAAHKGNYTGVPERTSTPTLCSRCHSDPEVMRPFGLPIDQMLYYRDSYHGKALARGDSRVAVCSDCHGAHGIQPPKQPLSPVNPLNIPDTCGRCHADAELMQSYGINPNVIQDYKSGIHYENLLKGNPNAPTCTTCHGKHGAAPPRVSEITEVCGLCHQKTVQMFMQSPHARAFPKLGLPMCVACHDNHATETPSNEKILQKCADCHKETEKAYHTGQQIQTLLNNTQMAIREAYDTLTHARQDGMLTNQLELRLEEASTYFRRLQPLIHTLNLHQIEQESIKTRSVTGEILSDYIEFKNQKRTYRFLVIALWFYIILSMVIIELRRRYPPRDE